MTSIPGRFTPKIASDFVKSFPELPIQHFRDFFGGPVSSIGVGTYLGELDLETDQASVTAMVRAVMGGINSLDTAINYRNQLSERCVGAAIQALQKESIPREALLISTKGGFLSPDAADQRNARTYFEEEYITTGIVKPQEIVAGCHVMSPAYIKNQISRSLVNLGLETIDIYYLHNIEMQAEHLGQAKFYQAVSEVFAALEQEVKDGRIGCYGVATWNGFRVTDDEYNFHALPGLLEAAEAVAGKNHHFQVIQLPFNLAMTEALGLKNMSFGGKAMSTLDVAMHAGLYAFASASLYQGQLAQGLPPFVKDVFKDQATEAAMALQFVRSTPGIGTALVGLKQEAHVDQALGVVKTRPLSREDYQQLLS